MDVMLDTLFRIVLGGLLLIAVMAAFIGFVELVSKSKVWFLLVLAAMAIYLAWALGPIPMGWLS